MYLVLNFAAPFVTVYLPEQSQGIPFLCVMNYNTQSIQASSGTLTAMMMGNRWLHMKNSPCLGNPAMSCIINSCLSTTDTKLFEREPCHEEVEVVVVHSRKGGHLWHVYCFVFNLEYTNSAKSHPTLANQRLFSYSTQRCLYLVHIICCPFCNSELQNLTAQNGHH